MMPMVAMTCPGCERTCRAERGRIRPGGRMRCPDCKGVFRTFIHGNDAVELRPMPPPLPPSAAGPRGLPPRVGGSEDVHRRTIFSGRRRNRPIGGYLPFEKSRSYIGTFALVGVLGLASLAAYWYFRKIDEIGNARGRRGTNAINRDLEVKRKAFRERQERALAALEARTRAGRGQSEENR